MPANSPGELLHGRRPRTVVVALSELVRGCGIVEVIIRPLPSYVSVRSFVRSAATEHKDEIMFPFSATSSLTSPSSLRLHSPMRDGWELSNWRKIRARAVGSCPSIFSVCVSSRCAISCVELTILRSHDSERSLEVLLENNSQLSASSFSTIQRRSR